MVFRLLMMLFIIQLFYVDYSVSDDLSDFNNKISKLAHKKIDIDDLNENEFAELSDDFICGVDKANGLDFRKIRINKTYSQLILKYLNKKYKIIDNQYESKIYGNDLSLYKKAYEYYLIEVKYYPMSYCSDGNIKKIKYIKSKIASIYKKKDMVGLEKTYIDVIGVCKFDSANIYLASLYKSKNEKEKYYNKMYGLIIDDQSVFDYMYEDELNLNYAFVDQYIDFLTLDIGLRSGPVADLKAIYEKLATVQSGLFDYSDRYYWHSISGDMNRENVIRSVIALMHICKLLEDNDMSSESEYLVKKLINDKEVIDLITGLPGLVDFVNRYKIGTLN